MDLKFLHGQSGNLPTEKSAGTVYVTKDKAEMFIDFDANTRVYIGSVEPVDVLPSNPVARKLYLLRPDKLYVYDTDWICLNELDKNALLQYIQANLSLPEIDLALGRYSSNTTCNADETVWTTTWTLNGNTYKKVSTEVSDTEWKTELFINNLLTERWVLTESATGGLHTEYTKI